MACASLRVPGDGNDRLWHAYPPVHCSEAVVPRVCNLDMRRATREGQSWECASIVEGGQLWGLPVGRRCTMMMIVHVLAVTGFFQWVAVRLAGIAGGDGKVTTADNLTVSLVGAVVSTLALPM
eukprot:4544032-Amphidinium_carterae.1